jgi:hypothetical protein
MPVIPALRRLRQEDNEFETSLGCIVRHNKHLKITFCSVASFLV